ncbi:amino acid permease [Purpureocillium lavendulum]|uniref:Amino acid permease n=1 Tax=Purpureocillium lavendulum TaxID=1247861 RepID=A0AB34FQR1_9HYPO|nr:amino acid permease [Purpureocillium lavendulum]
MRSQLLAAIAGTLCGLLTRDILTIGWWPRDEGVTSREGPVLSEGAWHRLVSAAAEMVDNGRHPTTEDILSSTRAGQTAPRTATRGMALLKQTLSRTRHTTQSAAEGPRLQASAADTTAEEVPPVFSLWNVDEGGRLQLAQLSWLGDEDRVEAETGRGGTGTGSRPDAATTARCCGCSDGPRSTAAMQAGLAAETAWRAIEAVGGAARSGAAFACAVATAAWAWTRGSASGLRCGALLVLLASMQTRGLRDGFAGGEATGRVELA